MKKYLGILIAVAFLIGGCSWSSLNPFAEKEEQHSVVELRVNHYLWHASIDKLSFTPCEIEDQKSGIIVTKWVRFSKNPTDLFKVKVKISGGDLRSDNLDVQVQKRQFKKGDWIDVRTNKTLESEIKHQILLKARDLYQKDLIVNKG